MRIGTTRRSTYGDGPLEHAVRDNVTTRRDRPRYRAYYGTIVREIHSGSFDRKSPRACARCKTALGPEATRP